MGSNAYDPAELSADEDERLLIASCVLYVQSNVAQQLRERLTVEDFRRADASLYFRAICQVAERGEPTVASAIAKEVRRLGGKEVRFLGDVAEWVQGLESERFVRYHADEVIAASQRRRLHGAASKVAQEAMRTGASADEVMRAAMAAVSEVQRTFHAQPDIFSPEDFALMVIARNAALDAGEHEPVLSTHLADLDHELNGGVRAGQLVVIGGRPGMGKSSLLRDMARAFCYQPRGHVFYVSNEMSAQDIANRDIAALSGVGLETVVKGNWTDTQRTAITRAESDIGYFPMTTYVDGALTSDRLRTRALEIHSRVSLSAIVVDYLQRMSDPGKTSIDRVGHAIRACKSLAIELKVPVIVGSQLNRAAEASVSKRPSLNELRESGEIEQESDIVILLFREGYYDARKGNEAEIIIAKQRQGVSGQTVKVAWLGSLATFRNLARG